MHIARPTEQCVSIYKPDKAYNGYTLFAPHATEDVWLVDMEGRIVHHWKLPDRLGSDVRLLPNAHQMRVIRSWQEPSGYMGTVGTFLQEVDWDGNILWEHEDPAQHHDFVRMANGNTMLNRHVIVPPEIAKTMKGGIPDTEPDQLDGAIWGNAFREITPDGETVWDWVGHEHMDPDIDTMCPICPRAIWGYVNGIDCFPNGDVVASYRYENSIFIVDRKTGDIKWRWGRWELGHQHNTTVLENGNVLVLDNGLHRLPPWEYRRTHPMETGSKVIEVNPKTDKIEWMYESDPPDRFFSAICSSAERLPNGNTLIGESLSGRIFEITPDKEIVWEFTNPFYGEVERLGRTNYIFRAHRYGAEMEGFKGKDMDPSRFEWTIQEKGVTVTGTETKKDQKEDTVQSRLARLGY
jgi:hypothetical protein